MSFIINTKERSTQIELMDDFSVEGNLLRDSLDSLANINKWLGGNVVTLNGIKKVLKEYNKHKTRIKDFSSEDQQLIYDKLQNWLGYSVTIYPLLE